MQLIHRLKQIGINTTLMKGALFSVFSFFNRGISFILLIIIAKYITPEEYGHLSLFNTIVQFLAIIIALSTEGYFSVSFFQRKGDLFKRDFTAINITLATVTLSISVILLLFNRFFIRALNLPISFFCFAIAISFFQVLFNILLDYYRVQEKIAKYGILSCGFAVFNFILSLYLVIGCNLNWNGRVYAQLSSLFFFGCISILLFILNHLYSKQVNVSDIKTIVIWGLPLIPHNAVNWIKQGGDTFIINHFHTLTDVGIFNFSLTLTSIIVMIGIAFNATNSVSIYQTLSSDISIDVKKQKLKTQTRNIIQIYIISYIAIISGGSILIPFALPAYTSTIPYFWITSIYGLLQCFYFLYCNYLFYYHHTKNIMMITFATAILHLSLSFILTKYSLFYTATIYVLTQFIVLLLIRKKSFAILNEYNYEKAKM